MNILMQYGIIVAVLMLFPLTQCLTGMSWWAWALIGIAALVKKSQVSTFEKTV